MHVSARCVRVSFRPLSLSLSSYQVVEVLRRQTGDRGLSPSNSTFKLFTCLIF